MTILLTWGTWYIGSHCAVDMIQAGHGVVIFDDLSNSSASVLDNIERITGVRPVFFQGDMKNVSDVQWVFSSHEIHSVIHFAWYKSVEESCEEPFKYYENNVVGTLNLLCVMEEYNVKDIIFSSSATVYDVVRSRPPFCEESNVSSSNPYGSTKLIVENMLSDFSQYKLFRSVSLRYFNPIWSHESHLIGEEPLGTPNNLLPLILKVAWWSREFITIFGNDYDSPDGTAVRDYLHVMDLVEAHRLALGSLEKQNAGFYDVYNLWTGSWVSVREMVDLVSQVTGVGIPTVMWSRRSGDVDVLVSNPDKAKRVLGWQAKRTIQQAIEDAWLFSQNHAS